MTKPLTDEEFEKVKKKDVAWTAPDLTENLTQDEFDRLIATVECKQDRLIEYELYVAQLEKELETFEDENNV